jgi:hypothetical protein
VIFNRYPYNHLHFGIWTEPDPFIPLTVNKFRVLSENEMLIDMPDDKLLRMWILPVQRKLQSQFGIDQRHYTEDSIPTLAELEVDFEVASVITIDKMALNLDDVSGPERVSGAFRVWNHKVPERAAALLRRHKISGRKVRRS